jgi:hypothetical protein
MLHSGGMSFKKPGGKNTFFAGTAVRANGGVPLIACSEGGTIMAMLVLTIIEFAGAMGVPVFLTAIVESAASKMRQRPKRRPGNDGIVGGSYLKCARMETEMRETWRVVSFWIRVCALFCLFAWKLLGGLVTIAVLNGWSNCWQIRLDPAPLLVRQPKQLAAYPRSCRERITIAVSGQRN